MKNSYLKSRQKLKYSVNGILILASILAIIIFSGCASSNSGETKVLPVRIYNTHGKVDFNEWTLVKGLSDRLNPEHTVVENGLIRLTFPCGRGQKGGDPVVNDQKAGHLLYLKKDGDYKLAQCAEFGDWIYVGDSMIDTLTGFSITKNTDSIVQFQMMFDNHYSSGGNQITFDPDSKNPVKKTVTMRRGQYGYLVHVDIARDLRGEREAGFGLAEKPTFYYNPETGHQRPDNRTTYLYLRQPGEMKNFWGTGIAPQKDFYRFLAVSPEYPHAIRSAQWSEGQIGAFYRWVMNGLAYEAYIAAVPYDASKARDITVKDQVASIEVPSDGKYSVFNGKGELYEPVLKNIELRKGINSIKIPDNINLDYPIIVPVSNGRDFPEDIYALYRDSYK